MRRFGEVGIVTAGETPAYSNASWWAVGRVEVFINIFSMQKSDKIGYISIRILSVFLFI